MTRKATRCYARNPATVAGAISEPSAGYGPGSSAYSPMLTGGQEAFGHTEDVTQPENPTAPSQGTPDLFVPMPPNPSYGGQPGRSHALGWTNGMLPSRTFRQRFRGAVVVRSSMGANPVVGPVGLSNRQGRLQAGVKQLVTDYLPSEQAVREQFTQPQAPVSVKRRNRNALGALLGR